MTHELPRAHFDGDDYRPARDDVRLRGQQLRIWELMRDQRWRTLAQIAGETGDPEASISAQLRHLRKPRFGSHIVEKEHIGDGLYHYRLLPPSDDDDESPVLPTQTSMQDRAGPKADPAQTDQPV